MDGAWRSRDRVDPLLVLLPALVGGFMGAVYAAADHEVGVDVPASLAYALPSVVLIALPMLWARSAPLESTIALSLAAGLGYVANELLRVTDAVPVLVAKGRCWR